MDRPDVIPAGLAPHDKRCGSCRSWQMRNELAEDSQVPGAQFQPWPGARWREEPAGWCRNDLGVPERQVMRIPCGTAGWQRPEGEVER